MDQAEGEVTKSDLCVLLLSSLQRALSAERQVETLREELVVAQNALQVCSVFQDDKHI